MTGLFVGALTNPRMGLSAHLEGVMNGTFLVVLGLMWKNLRLGRKPAKTAFWLALYAAYVNWASTLAAAIFGTSEMTPIAGAGFLGEPWQEHLVSVALATVATAMVAACAIVLWGLRRPAENSQGLRP
ncbi:MAG TPA: hydrogenase [Acidobacteriota bacterium]